MLFDIQCWKTFIGVRRWNPLFNRLPVINVLCKKKANDYPEIHWKSYLDGGGDDDNDNENVITCLYIHIEYTYENNLNSVIY